MTDTIDTLPIADLADAYRDVIAAWRERQQLAVERDYERWRLLVCLPLQAVAWDEAHPCEAWETSDST
jgi:hypothetical protein